ncbi:MAG: hypothetical protein ACHP93_07300 [Solirubrobacterales bacterium]
MDRIFTQFLARHIPDSTAANAQVQATVTWNGQNISHASSAGSGFDLGYGTNIDIRFYWSAPATSAPVPVETARLQMFFMGLGIATRDVRQDHPAGATNGTIDLAWSGAGILAYLIEGTYQVTASLLDGNSTSLWSENFYVKMTAPGEIFALVPIVLLVLGVYELVSLARSGRREASREKPPKPGQGASPGPEGATSSGASPGAKESVPTTGKGGSP